MVQVAVAAELDLATKGDIESLHRSALHKHESSRMLRLDAPFSGVTDNTGALNLRIYQNAPQRRAVIGRVMIWAQGYTPVAPFSGTGFWYGIFGDPNQSPGSLRDFQPYQNATAYLPNVAAYSDKDCPVFGIGEDIYLAMVAGPASKTIFGRVIGVLEPEGMI